MESITIYDKLQSAFSYVLASLRDVDTVTYRIEKASSLELLEILDLYPQHTVLEHEDSLTDCVTLYVYEPITKGQAAICIYGERDWSRHEVELTGKRTLHAILAICREIERGGMLRENVRIIVPLLDELTDELGAQELIRPLIKPKK